MNIVLIIFDSLRKDCVGAYGQPPWGKVFTPHMDTLARQSIRFTCAYPESLPTLPARRALYTGQRTYPFHNGDFRLKGDFLGAAGWGPIPEEQPTLAEMLQQAGYRTGLVADVYHLFKPSKNFWRGFDQWSFLRGQEMDPHRSGPQLTQEEYDRWVPREMQSPQTDPYIKQWLLNTRDRHLEEEYFPSRVFREAARWLEQNRDAEKFFLTVESFDPHEPWLIPDHYRRMYLKKDGPEQIRSGYADTSALAPRLLERTRANYSGSVTQCDRWLGHFMESMRVLGLLDNTMVIVTSDHGHSIGDDSYMGKRGYPSRPPVFDIPLMVRLPQARHAGRVSRAMVQHTDIAAEILHSAGVRPPVPIHGQPFLRAGLGGKAMRDHVTVGWGPAFTVITPRWWFNCKVNGKGAFLYDRRAKAPFASNVARQNTKVVRELFKLAQADAGGSFPQWLLDAADLEADVPGCSDLAARK